MVSYHSVRGRLRLIALTSPDGQIDHLWLSSQLCKNIPFSSAPNQNYKRRISSHQEGRSRSSRTLGTRCGGRDSALDGARVSRTTKSCGSDASTLASSLREHFRRRR